MWRLCLNVKQNYFRIMQLRCITLKADIRTMWDIQRTVIDKRVASIGFALLVAETSLYAILIIYVEIAFLKKFTVDISK